MRPFSVFITLLLGIVPCSADVQSSLFRQAYSCSQQRPTQLCLFGTVPKGKPVTLFAKGWKSSAVPKEEIPNTEFGNGAKKITRLLVATPPAKDTLIIAVLTPTETIKELPLQEVQDQAIVQRIDQYIKKTDALNLDPDIRILKTRLLRLSPTILLSEIFLAPGRDDPDVWDKQLLDGCKVCEKVALLVGSDFDDLFKETRSKTVNAVEHICGGIEFAFTIAGRTYVTSDVSVCESDSFSATLIHDLSGQKPKLVFQSSGGL